MNDSASQVVKSTRVGGGVVLLLLGIVAGAAGMRAWMNHTALDARSAAQPEHEHDRSDVEDHENDEHEASVRLPGAIETYGIQLAAAGPGGLARSITLPGEVRLDADRVAHIVPRVAGMVREVKKNVGESATPGELIAVLDSRELADAKAADLAAASRHVLALANLERAQRLFDQKIGPEEELLKAKQAVAESDIDHRTAGAKLHALGLTQEQVDNLHDEKDTDYSRYEIRAPFAGTVIEKHITLGEVVGLETTCFVLADLSKVWLDITVYPQDMTRVAIGRPVTVTDVGTAQSERGEISYVSPNIDESTRTGMARVVLSNPHGRWRPGTFVSADVVVSADQVLMLVPKSALQTIGKQTVVFIAAGGQFAKRPVTIGRSTDTHAEILSGLNPGEIYAAAGAFILKAELGKAEAEHAH